MPNVIKRYLKYHNIYTNITKQATGYVIMKIRNDVYFEFTGGFSDKESEFSNGYFSKWHSNNGIINDAKITYDYTIIRYKSNGIKDVVKGKGSIDKESFTFNEYNTFFIHYNNLQGNCKYTSVTRLKYHFEKLLFRMRRTTSTIVHLLSTE